MWTSLLTALLLINSVTSASFLSRLHERAFASVRPATFISPRQTSFNYTTTSSDLAWCASGSGLSSRCVLLQNNAFVILGGSIWLDVSTFRNLKIDTSTAAKLIRSTNGIDARTWASLSLDTQQTILQAAGSDFAATVSAWASNGMLPAQNLDAIANIHDYFSNPNHAKWATANAESQIANEFQALLGTVQQSLQKNYTTPDQQSKFASWNNYNPVKDAANTGTPFVAVSSLAPTFVANLVNQHTQDQTNAYGQQFQTMAAIWRDFIAYLKAVSPSSAVSSDMNTLKAAFAEACSKNQADTSEYAAVLEPAAKAIAAGTFEQDFITQSQLPAFVATLIPKQNGPTSTAYQLFQQNLVSYMQQKGDLSSNPHAIAQDGSLVLQQMTTSQKLTSSQKRAIQQQMITDIKSGALYNYLRAYGGQK